MIVYGIKDVKSGSFINLMTTKNDEMIKRDFKNMINNQNAGLLFLCPQDFELYRVAEFEENSGLMKPLEIEMLLNGIELKEIDNENK